MTLSQAQELRALLDEAILKGSLAPLERARQIAVVAEMDAIEDAGGRV